MNGPCHVIKTTAFAIEPGEDAETNPGVFGRSLATYVAEQMRVRGESVEGLIAEDFGWCVMLRRKPLTLWIACGNREGRTEEWIAFAVAEGGLINKLLGKVNPSQEVRRISEMLGDIMQSAPGVEFYSVEE
jgi:hypothetical protein